MIQIDGMKLIFEKYLQNSTGFKKWNRKAYFCVNGFRNLSLTYLYTNVKYIVVSSICIFTTYYVRLEAINITLH